MLDGVDEQRSLKTYRRETIASLRIAQLHHRTQLGPGHDLVRGGKKFVTLCWLAGLFVPRADIGRHCQCLLLRRFTTI